MAKTVCAVCKEEMKFGFMDKVVGTVVWVKEGESKRKVYVCPACQKKHKDELKDKVS